MHIAYVFHNLWQIHFILLPQTRFGVYEYYRLLQKQCEQCRSVTEYMISLWKLELRISQ